MELQTLLPSANNYGVLNGATHVVPVTAPGEGRARLVFTVGVNNLLGGAVIQLNVFINDQAATRYQLDSTALAANTTWSLSDKFPNGVFLRDTQFLELVAGGASTLPWHACWADLPRYATGRS